ncbi:MAG: sorbosone dehydrogenase family protein [Acidobacteriota bacterium]
MSSKPLAACLVVVASLLPSCTSAPPVERRAPPVQLIDLPEGFVIELAAAGIEHARSMARSPAGTLFVGSRKSDVVRALRDEDGDGYFETVHVLLSGLNSPNGVAYRAGALYVAEIHRVIRLDDIDARLTSPPEPVVVRDDFPTDPHHGWKFLRFGPDGWLYVPVGAPCNICDAGDPYAAILRMKPDGSDLQVFARGVRNTVGFDWHPTTGELWFTDNGRDWLGDHLPPDELNHAPEAGLHFGYPWCHGTDLVDTDFPDRGCDGFRPAAQELGAHVASLGMRFYTGDSFPEEYRNQVFIAEHGSWNSSVKVGYQVSLVRLEGNRPVSYEPFATGWLRPHGGVRGRPVDLLVEPDGSLLVSDDGGGAIYRIRHVGTDAAETR